MIPEDPINPAVGTPVNLLTSFGLRDMTKSGRTRKRSTTLQPGEPKTRTCSSSALWIRCRMLARTSQPPQNKFIINGIPCGVLLLKVLIQVSAIDSNATVSSIRSQMGDLHEHIVEVGCDIIKFNEHVMLLVEKLSQRGQTSTDLLVNLFKACKAVRDQEFVQYIKDKESWYEEGHALSVDRIMDLAQEKYKILVDKDEWEAPSPGPEGYCRPGIAAYRCEKGAQEGQQQQKSPGTTKEKDKRKPKGTQKGTKPDERPDWLQKNVKPKESIQAS